MRNRARFTRLALDSVAMLPHGLRKHLAEVEIRIEDLPPVSGGDLPLARLERGRRPDGRTGDRLTVYRRPLELRAADRDDLGVLIRTAVVECIAERHDLDPDDLDELGWR